MIKTLRPILMPTACTCAQSSKSASGQSKLQNLKSKAHNNNDSYTAIVDFGSQAAAERDIDINSKLLNNNTTTKKSSSAKKTAVSWLKSSSSSSASSSNSSSSSSTPRTMDLLQLLAINALEFTAPASAAFFLQSPSTKNSPSSTNSSDIKSLGQCSDETQHPIQHIRRSFVQLSGHPGCFAPAGPNTLWKKQGDGSYETNVYEYLSNSDDCMKYVIPQFCSKTEFKGEMFLEIEDLLTGFDNDAAVMDLKIGYRTFLESEVTNSSARHDLYLKMVKVDPNAPTLEEHESKSVTKLRYMQFREEQSSTSSLGFRIEAIKFRNSKEPKKKEMLTVMSDLKLTKTENDVKGLMTRFLPKDPSLQSQLLERLHFIRTSLESSSFFMTHEVIGSSVLLIHDDSNVGAWLIDFAKTVQSPVGRLKHTVHWEMGSHEDGYLSGIDNLIRIIEAAS